MNPFNNNKPLLTASDRIRDKRDAVIYQAAKQQFQNKKCDKNVKYYNNGTIRSMNSYGLQKSLARGSVLCEDCDYKGLLCGGVENKDALASIHMGNNIVSEYWGGGGIFYDDDVGWSQTPGFPVIQSDISGVWDPSAATVTDPSKSTLAPGFGYIDNLIKIPRNLDGSGIVIDPSNILFPDELCDPFRYLQHCRLKTYLVISTILPDNGDPPPYFYDCNDISLNSVPGTYISVVQDEEEWTAGIVKSICCKGTIHTYPNGYAVDEQNCGIFDLYVELLNIKSYARLNALLAPPKNRYDPTVADYYRFGDFFIIRFYQENLGGGNTIILRPWLIESFNIIQGTIPPSLNQTKYNATQQTYLSCLENGTRKINFTKNIKKENNVISAYCKEADMIE
jgi:hypothetical protein